MESPEDILRRLDNQKLVAAIRSHTSKHGWHNTAKTLREVASVHVGWDSNFTELCNVLRRIENDFKGQVLEAQSEIPRTPKY